MLRKAALWIGVIFVVYYTISDPTGAAGVLRSIGHGMTGFGHSISSFVGGL